MFDTWGGRSEFDYAGDITTGTRIIYVAPILINEGVATRSSDNLLQF